VRKCSTFIVCGYYHLVAFESLEHSKGRQSRHCWLGRIRTHGRKICQGNGCTCGNDYYLRIKRSRCDEFGSRRSFKIGRASCRERVERAGIEESGEGR